MCDIIAQADCRKIIINDVPRFEGVSAWGEYFSLHAFGMKSNIEEITWPEERDKLLAVIEAM